MQTNATLKSTSLVAFDPAEIPIPLKVIVLVGSAAELHPLVLQSLFALTSRGERVGMIIGDNHFDQYALARFARTRGFDPSALLNRIEFSRPFTCHQLHHCVVNLDTTRAKNWDALYLLGLLETFWDEDIHYAEAMRLLNEILARLKRLAADGLPVLITISPPPIETNRQSFVARVLGAADGYWTPAPLAIQTSGSPQLALW